MGSVRPCSRILRVERGAPPSGVHVRGGATSPGGRVRPGRWPEGGTHDGRRVGSIAANPRTVDSRTARAHETLAPSECGTLAGSWLESVAYMPVDKPSLSIVVPVYNSEASLRPLVDRLESALPQVASAYELILVNDGSRDGSWALVQELARRHAWIRGADLLRNYGQHNALLYGIRQARYSVVVTMDDDLQHPPEELGKLLAELNRGFDVVYGTPVKLTHGFVRNLASRTTKLVLQKSMGAETAGKVSAYRAMRTHVRDGFAAFRGQFVSLDVLLTWSTARFSAVEVRHDPRTIGTSNYTYKKLMTYAINMITGFSTLPLQIASILGLVLTVFGLGILTYVVVAYFTGRTTEPGFTFLASIIAIFSGAQLFALGIMGEYLARMHFRMMDRPTYAVRETTGRAEGG